MNEAQKQLSEAKTLISDSANWCQHANARSNTGQEVDVESESATKWCAFGALLRTHCRGSCVLYLDQAAEELCCGKGFVKTNDTTDHPTVMRMFDRAIELAGES